MARQWAASVQEAIKVRDTAALRTLEERRLALKDQLGSPHIVFGVLCQAARVQDLWGVRATMGFPSSAAQVEAALGGFLNSLDPRKSDEIAKNKELKAIWDTISPSVTLDAMERIWGDEIKRQHRVPVRWFVERGVQVTASTPLEDNVVRLGGRLHLLSIPVRYREEAGQEVDAGAPMRQSPLMACWGADNPTMAMDLMGMGVDPWSPMPGTVPSGWTLAAALGLQEGAAHAPEDPANPYPESQNPGLWWAVRSFLLEQALEKTVPHQEEDGPKPSVPGRRF